LPLAASKALYNDGSSDRAVAAPTPSSAVDAIVRQAMAGSYITGIVATRAEMAASHE